MNIQQTFESLYERIKERIGSPFFGSALMSWPLINYKFLITALGEGRFIEKVFFIENHIYPDSATRWFYMVCAPAAAGLFYTLIYPLIDIVLTMASKWLFSMKQKMVFKIERKTPIDSREQAEFFESYDRKVKKLEEAFDDQTKRHMAQFTEASKDRADIASRLKEQALRRLTHGTGLKSQDITSLVHSDPIMLKNRIPMIKEQIRSADLLKGIPSLLETISQQATWDLDKGMVTNLPAIAQVMKINEEELLTSIELLQALDLVTLGGASPTRTIEISSEPQVSRSISNIKTLFTD